MLIEAAVALTLFSVVTKDRETAYEKRRRVEDIKTKQYDYAVELQKYRQEMSLEILLAVDIEYRVALEHYIYAAQLQEFKQQIRKKTRVVK